MVSDGYFNVPGNKSRELFLLLKNIKFGIRLSRIKTRRLTMTCFATIDTQHYCHNLLSI